MTRVTFKSGGSLGHTDCAWESCHLVHNTDELWALECETSQPCISGLMNMHKMKAALAAPSQTSWRGMAWAGHLTTRQHLCAHQHKTEKPKEGSVSDHTELAQTYRAGTEADAQMENSILIRRQLQRMHVQTWECKIRLDTNNGEGEHKRDNQT